MTIQELIKTCDYSKTAEAWMKEDWLLSEKEKKSEKRLEIATERIRNFCEMLCGLTPKPSEYVLLALPYIGFSREWEIEAELIKKADFEKALELIEDKKFPIYSENDTEERLSEINKKVRTWLPIAYAYEFSEWEEILGAEVFPDNFEQVKDAFLSAVLYELSYNGMSRENHDERRKELDESIAEAKEILKLSKEERDRYIKSWDEIKKELEFDGILQPSDEEIEEERCHMVYDSLRGAEGWVRELKKLSDSYLTESKKKRLL